MLASESGTETVLRVLQDPKLIEAFLEVLKPHSNFQAEMNAASIVSVRIAFVAMAPHALKAHVSHRPWKRLARCAPANPTFSVSFSKVH